MAGKSDRGELVVPEDICPACGTCMVLEEGKYVCPHCDGDIDYFGDKDE